MSASVSLSIATNTAIAVSKGIGWILTGSPTLFAETIHSLADVGKLPAGLGAYSGSAFGKKFTETLRGLSPEFAPADEEVIKGVVERIRGALPQTTRSELTVRLLV